MKKRIPELLDIYDQYMKEHLNKRGVSYLGNNLNVLANSSLAYQRHVDEVEKELVRAKTESLIL